MKISEIKELIQLVNDSEISEMELQKEEVKLIVRKGGREMKTPVLPDQAASMPHESMFVHSLTAAPAATSAPPVVRENAPAAEKGQPLKAPMVGTFYRAPRPDVDPFVGIGDRVKPGQTLCIIEAMKLMNEIEAEFSGIIVDILAEDGQPVEYGQTLFLIDPGQ